MIVGAQIAPERAILLTIAAKAATIVRKRRQFCGNRSERDVKCASLQRSLASRSLGDRDSRARIGCKRLLFGRGGYDHAGNFTERGNDIRRNRV
jgi:hypothetical protein